MTASRARLAAILIAILAAATLRLVPHPPNFTPIGAMALFAGAYLAGDRSQRALAFAAPLAALLLSDLVLGFYPGMAWQYVATALAVAIGWALLGSERSPLRIGGSALLSACLFFLVSNFGAWLSLPFYAKTLAGLGAAYAAAIPFFQNSLAGDLIWSALLFGGFALAERALPALRQPAAARA